MRFVAENIISKEWRVTVERRIVNAIEWRALRWKEIGGKKLLRRRHERGARHFTYRKWGTHWEGKREIERGDVEKKEELDDKIYSNKTIYGAHNGK